VACRRTGEQSSFVRLVRTVRPDDEGGTVIDVDDGRRRLPGRGAYLCRQQACWERGLRGALPGNLRVTLTDENREHLRAFGATLPEVITDTMEVAPEGKREGEDS